MFRSRAVLYAIFLVATIYLLAVNCLAFQQRQNEEDEFGPVVRAYLGYLRNEQEVVDDRISRREISPLYYRRNSNRIRALRLMAIRIARETRNDYLPELEAVARDELGTLFEHPPRPGILKPNEVLNDTFRFLGAVRSGEVFYVFARLDIYEQAERRQQDTNVSAQSPSAAHRQNEVRTRAATRSRRVSSP